MKREKSFTLIELLVVIAIIGLLTSIVLVSLQGAREKAQITKTLQWSRSIKAQLGGDIVGDWNFNEGTSTKALDATGYNQGTLGNGACTPGSGSCPSWTDGVQGLTGKALYFDGVDDYVNCGNNPSLNPKNAITVEIWIKSTATYTGSWHDVINSNGHSNCDGGSYCLRYLTNLLYYHFYNSTGSGCWQSIPISTVNDGNWHHVLIRYDGTYGEIYLDAQRKQQCSLSGELRTMTNNLVIGKNSLGVNGTIDEVRVYSRALTAFEIQKHYVEGAERHGIALK